MTYRVKSIGGQSEFMAVDGVAVIGFDFQFKWFYGDGMGGFGVCVCVVFVIYVWYGFIKNLFYSN